MFITIHSPFYNQHNLRNFTLDSPLPNATVQSLLFPSPKFHCPLPNLSLPPNLTTHPSTHPPRNNLTINCPQSNLNQFHKQLPNLSKISII